MNDYLELLTERSLMPRQPDWSETPLGRAAEIRSRAKNLLSRELSLGQSSDALEARSPLSVSSHEGFTGSGCLEWLPSAHGEFIEFDLPEVLPTDHIRGDSVGIFVAMCLSMRVDSDVGLNLSMEGQTEDQAEATPGFVAAGLGNWQRIAVALRAMDSDRPRARLTAHGAGRVLLDALQFEPRTYPVWMITEPMRTGMWGPWVEGETAREDDRLWAELESDDIPAAGAITAWIQPDWPSSEFPHTVFDAGFERLFMAYHNARFIGAASGSQVGGMNHTNDWRTMMRLEPGRWHHVGLSWNEEGEVALSMDGECYSRRVTHESVRLKPFASDRMFIGCPSQEDGYQNCPDMPGCFDGLIADIRIYPSALDDAEMAMLHLEGRQKLETANVEMVDVRFGKDELIRQSTFYCWFANKLGRMPDGSIETWAATGPDYGPRPDYWPETRQHYRKTSPDGPWQPFQSDFILGRAPLHLPDGRLLTWAIDHRQKSEAHQGMLAGYVISEDGEQWEPFDPEMRLPEHETFSVSRFLADSTGRILACGSIKLKSREETGDIRDMLFGPATGQTELFIAASTDNGQTFELLSLITEGRRPQFGDYCEENTLIEVQPGESGLAGDLPELLFVGRVRGHMVPCVQMRSLDGGKSWSHPELCPFGAVMPRMLRLSNGLVVLITGRPETVLHWTADGGQTWSPPVSLYDSREQSLQSENIWYGPSTGYGSIMEFAPDTLWVSYDRLGAYDPETLQRTNQVHVREVSFSRVACEVAPVPLDHFKLSGNWQSLDGVGVWTDDGEAKAELEFEGTGIAITHPLLRHGGMLKATIDGQPVGEANCYDPLPHHASGRTVLASGLTDGRHHLTLEPDLSGSARHAHGDGAELGGILSWLYLAHCGPDRWSGLCGAEVFKKSQAGEL